MDDAAGSLGCLRREQDQHWKASRSCLWSVYQVVFGTEPCPHTMTLDPKLTKLLNEQINNEMASSYTYLAMSAWFEQTPYSGFASWMFNQSREETMHALKFYQYVVDRDAVVELEPISKPKHKFKSPLDVFEQSLKQEQLVTKQINDLYDVAEQVKDHAAKNLLLWFLNEQMEEEKTVRDMLDRLKLAGNDPASLLVLDREAGQRQGAASKNEAAE
ncbi:MAG TPA: ferritin [Verrucomicrobiales bacterium]|nr:ferritin [Verrucomicrobiales bacterium]